MCCYTHPYTTEATAAKHENERCRCPAYSGYTCQRKATQEDLLCNYCAGRVAPDSVDEYLGPMYGLTLMPSSYPSEWREDVLQGNPDVRG